MASIHAGAAYNDCGSTVPLYIVFVPRVSVHNWFSPT